jgi:hypothetical protein
MGSLVRSDPLCRGIGWTTSLATPHGLLLSSSFGAFKIFKPLTA